jgi:hypothetical protein
MRRLRLMLVCLAGLLTAVATVNWIVNPYGAWRPTLIDPAHRVSGAARGEAGERVTTAYRLRADRPATVLVGSSRVVAGMYIERGTRDGVLNAGLSGVSLAEIGAILRQAAANPRLKRVVWGVDFYTFDDRFAGFPHPETRVRLEGAEWQVAAMRIKETLLSLGALGDSLKVVRKAARGRREGPFTAPVPWPEDVIRARLAHPGRPGLAAAGDAALKAQLANWVANYTGYRLSESLRTGFVRAVEATRRAGVEVVLFVPPLSRCELEVVDRTSWDAFQAWKRQLLDAGPYWDFSGFGKLDRSDRFFLDVAHFWPAVGHTMLRQFLGVGCEGCGDLAGTVWAAGTWVDRTTIDAHLAEQEARRATARTRTDRCTRVVAEMLPP